MAPAFTIPELYCPFPSSNHPQVHQLRQHAIDWAERFHLLQTPASRQRFQDAAYWDLIARAYPTAAFDDLALINDWNCWGFLLDDVDDEGPVARQPGEMRQLFIDVALVMMGKQPTSTGGPLIDGLRDVWGRIVAVTTAAWQDHFRHILGAGLEAYKWEVGNRVGGRIPERETYITQRRQTGGWLTDVALVDVARHVPMPSEILDEPRLQDMLEAANNVICWANDLYSLDKEIAHHEVHNLVIIVQHEQGCSLQSAVDQVARMHDHEVRRFEAAALSRPHYEDARDDAIWGYIDFCRRFMRGNLDWSRTTGRYSQVESTKVGEALSYLDPIMHQKRVGLLGRWLRRKDVQHATEEMLAS